MKIIITLIRRCVDAAFGLIRLCYVVVVILLLVSFGSNLFSGCNMLDRSAPSQAQYIAEYMQHFDESQIEKIDYYYKGAIGGALTAARVQFKGPVEIRGDVKVGAYDPKTVTEDSGDMMWFRHRWENHCGGTLPAWFDFPFEQPMRTIREERDREECREGEPVYHYEWYIDDRRNVVYFMGGWG